ncbi:MULTISPECIES: hypothetical protein [Streptomyces]|nr:MULTISPECIES: hypothetical protein [Streptomyces]
MPAADLGEQGWESSRRIHTPQEIAVFLAGIKQGQADHLASK